MDQQTVSFEVDNKALATVQGLSITANFDEMEAALTEMMAPYKGLVVTDIGAAKSARAYVNKVRKSLDDTRKTVKKLYQQPLADFEDRVKHLTAICDEASGAIDAQIKAVEQQEKEARIAEIRAHYDEAALGMEAYVAWERIYNPRWETKTYGTVAAMSDIDAAVAEAKSNMELVLEMHSPFETALLLVLQETGDMGKVLRKKAACEALAREMAGDDGEGPQTAPESRGAPDHTETPPTAAKRENGSKIYCFTLSFEATSEQARLISDFFTKNNIRYRKVR